MRENSNLALDQLHQLIKAKQLAEGDQLPPERELEQRFGVSRRAVRRALEVLEAEGKIWRRQGSGTFVGTDPDQHHVTEHAHDTFMEVLEVRLRIEPQVVQLAAMRATADDIVRLRQMIEKVAQSNDEDAQELWDGAFHHQIAKCAGNKLFMSIFDVINQARQDDTWRMIRMRAREGQPLPLRSYAEHTAIVDAIEAHDPAMASKAMRQHLLRLQTDALGIISTDYQEAPAEAGVT